MKEPCVMMTTDGVSSEPIVEALLAHVAPPASALPG